MAVKSLAFVVTSEWNSFFLLQLMSLAMWVLHWIITVRITHSGYYAQTRQIWYLNWWRQFCLKYSAVLSQSLWELYILSHTLWTQRDSCDGGPKLGRWRRSVEWCGLCHSALIRHYPGAIQRHLPFSTCEWQPRKYYFYNARLSLKFAFK